MSRSIIHLRRGLLGLALAGSLGFGATQALAGPESQPAQARLSCPDRGYDYAYAACRQGCSVGGYCAAGGTCRCGYIP